MACHPEPPVSPAVLAFFDERYMRRDTAHQCCSSCGGLRCLVPNPCPHVGCPLREAVEEIAA
jgi:hypothetical protein